MVFKGPVHLIHTVKYICKVVAFPYYLFDADRVYNDVSCFIPDAGNTGNEIFFFCFVSISEHLSTFLATLKNWLFIATKIARYWHKIRHTDQWNRINGPGINSHSYSYPILLKIYKRKDSHFKK